MRVRHRRIALCFRLGAAFCAVLFASCAESGGPTGASPEAVTASPSATMVATTGESPASPSAGRGSPDPDTPHARPGLLTAAVWDDFTTEHWSDYQAFLRRYEQDPQRDPRFDLRRAARVRLDHHGVPLRNVPVTVEQGAKRYALTTLHDGTVRLFPGSVHALEAGPITLRPAGAAVEDLTIGDGDGAIFEAVRSVDRAPDVAPGAPRLDLGLMVDATGSMGDEMTYLQAELRDIIAHVKPAGSELTVRIAVVYYRDRGDEFVTRVAPFGTDLDETMRFLGATRADGGGDFPEDMNAAFEATMRLDWSGPGQAARMLVVLADAPPHPYDGARYTTEHALADALRKGISIFPIAASGVDKPTEHLFRGLAAATGGKYAFLTDDSGIGNPHMKPDIQGYKVEPLNRLLVREIRDFVSAHYPQLAPVAAGDEHREGEQPIRPKLSRP